MSNNSTNEGNVGNVGDGSASVVIDSQPMFKLININSGRSNAPPVYAMAATRQVIAGEETGFVDVDPNNTILVCVADQQKVYNKDGIIIKGPVEVPSGLFETCFGKETVNKIKYMNNNGIFFVITASVYIQVVQDPLLQFSLPCFTMDDLFSAK